MKIHYFEGVFTADEVIKHLNLNAQGNRVYTDMIKNREVIKKAKALSLTVSDEALQHFVDDFRSARGMYSSEETLNMLDRAGLTIDDLEAFCETTLLTQVVKNHLAKEPAIETYFINHRSQFDQARISIAVVENEALANELIMQVSEEEADFHALARRYSIDPNSRYTGGYVGLIKRNTFTEVISAKVFNAVSGDLLGPFNLNGNYQLILVEELIKPVLDDHIRDEIREALFMEWLAPFLQEGVHCR